MFLLYRCMEKLAWQIFKTYDGQTFKCPRSLSIGENLVADFDGAAQAISLKLGQDTVGHDFLIKGKGTIKCQDIEVEEPQKRHGFGSLMHALSIMIMKENKAKNIYLSSLPQAIRFHFNNGFRTSANNGENARIYMKSIMRSNTGYSDLKTAAEKIYWELSFPNNGSLEKANRLYDEYLTRVFKHGVTLEDASFPSTLNMNLTMKDVKKHSKMYNETLQRYGIDYTI